MAWKICSKPGSKASLSLQSLTSGQTQRREREREPHEAHVYLKGTDGTTAPFALSLDPTKYNGSIAKWNRIVLAVDEEQKSISGITAIFSGETQIYGAATQK